MSIEILGSSLIYANPKPHLRSRQGAFPTVVRLRDGSLLASYMVGEAFESADGHTELSRSTDDGASWEMLGPMPRTPAAHPTSESGRLSVAHDGTVLCYVPRFDRSDPEKSIGNAETNGLIECDLGLYRSTDDGKTWSDIELIDPGVPGPYEVASPIRVLSDGRWLAIFSTWRAWDGTRRTPERTMALVSADEGRTWGPRITLFEDPEDLTCFWETRVIELNDGRLLTLCWAHDHRTAKDLPNQFAISTDGLTFSERRSTGLPGQTCSPIDVGDGKLLCVYNHRYDDPGVRAALVEYSDNGDWPVVDQITLWGQSAPTARAASVVGSMNQFRFGYPTVMHLSGRDYLVAFWCMENSQLVCRSTRIRLS